MAIYVNLKCPKCNYSLSKGFVPTGGIKFNLGVPYVKCPNCHTLISTGKKAWSQMTENEKKSEKRKAIGQTFISGLMYMSIPILISIFFTDGEKINENVFLFVIISYSIGLLIAYFTFWIKFKKLILEVEDIIKRKAWDEFYTML